MRGKRRRPGLREEGKKRDRVSGKESKSDGREREIDAEKDMEERKCELNVNDVIFLSSIFILMLPQTSSKSFS